jgi:NADPH2:quinone reductase
VLGWPAGVVGPVRGLVDGVAEGVVVADGTLLGVVGSALGAGLGVVTGLAIELTAAAGLGEVLAWLVVVPGLAPGPAGVLPGGRGTLKIDVTNLLPLEQAADGLATIAAGHAHGKIVVTIAD